MIEDNGKDAHLEQSASGDDVKRAATKLLLSVAGEMRDKIKLTGSAASGEH